MIPPIRIDVSDIAEEFDLSRQEIDSMMKSVLSGIVDEFVTAWEKLVAMELHQTRAEYLRGIFVERVDDFNAVVGLTSRGSSLPLMLEEGVSPFDIKEGFEKSKKKKFKADGGWYLTVPFRHGTPGIVGDSSVFSNTLPEQVHKLAKSKSKTQPRKGLTAKELPKEFRVKQKRELIVTPNKRFEEYQHKHSIYEGVAKRSFGAESSYTSFRRVSDTSDPNSWIHSGLQARKLMEKALDKADFDRTFSSITNDFLNNL